MADWKFGDIIRRVDDGGDREDQALAMVIGQAPMSHVALRGIGLCDKGSTGYRTGMTENNILPGYWELVTDD